MSVGGQVPEGIDASVATAARIYDYFLGGHNNFAADRNAALKIAERSPDAPLAARANREFLGRAVRFLAGEAGIQQFFDIGTGLPTKGNVHQVAQAIAPGTRVVYVDNDPMVLVHSRALKTGDNGAVIHADLRDAATILGHEDTRRLIDFTQPLAILFAAVLHFVPDPDAQQAVASFTSVAPPGSYVALSHVTGEPDPEAAEWIQTVLAATANPGRARTRQEILGFFGGADLLEPGLVPVHQWRPGGPGVTVPGKDWVVGGIGRIRDDHVPVPVAQVPRRQAPPPPKTRVAAQQPAAPVSSESPPLGIDITKATAARMYDYWLGGHNNFAADRIAALKISEQSPEAPLAARKNRAFLQRAVHFLAADAGIQQFLDIGTGLPTMGNVHQVAQAVTPSARVVYVDNDPMVLAHARALKTGENATVIQADLREADTILGHPDTRRLIDFTQPLAVLFVALLHFVGDPDAREAVAKFVNRVAPGSYLVISHLARDEVDPQTVATGTAVYARTANPVTARPRAEILEFFHGLDMVEPGLVPVAQWRPDQREPVAVGQGLLGGVGRKPA